jgi:hypothetical protein
VVVNERNDPRSSGAEEERAGLAPTSGADARIALFRAFYFTNWNFLDSVHLRIAGMPVSGS